MNGGKRDRKEARTKVTKELKGGRRWRKRKTDIETMPKHSKMREIHLEIEEEYKRVVVYD